MCAHKNIMKTWLTFLPCGCVSTKLRAQKGIIIVYYVINNNIFTQVRFGWYPERRMEAEREKLYETGRYIYVIITKILNTCHKYHLFFYATRYIWGQLGSNCSIPANVLSRVATFVRDLSWKKLWYTPCSYNKQDKPRSRVCLRMEKKRHNTIAYMMEYVPWT